MAYPSVSFKHKDATLGLQPISETSTTQQHPIGKIVSAFDFTYGEGEFIYLAGYAATAAGDVCSYDTVTGIATPAVGNTDKGSIGVAMSANVANQYGWYQISGSGPVNATTVLAARYIHLTAVAGQIDDGISAGNRVDGAVTLSTDSGGFATIKMDRPSVSGNGGSSGTNSGDVTLAAVGSSANANGATLTNQVLNLEPATGGNPGVVTTGTQTFAGSKTIDLESIVNAQATSVASGTGITAFHNGAPKRGLVKLTIGKAAWTAAATTQDITLCTIPARTRICAVYCATVEAYAGLAGTIQLQVGTTVAGQELIILHDVKTATITTGLLDTELGASFVRSAAIQGAFLPSFTGSTNIIARLVSGVGNIGTGAATNLTDGITTYYVVLEAL